MAIYDGTVTVADDDIPVMVELDDGHIRLSASGHEIGEWPAHECHITHLSDTTYTITAEDETIEFVPNQPVLFAAEVNGHTGSRVTPPSPAVEAETAPGKPGPGTPPHDEVAEAPPAKPLTMGLFYALCLVTAGLAIWSLISIVF